MANETLERSDEKLQFMKSVAQLSYSELLTLLLRAPNVPHAVKEAILEVDFENLEI
jgi:hypothetical protein